MAHQEIAGAILAGGEGRRIGGRKALVPLAGAPLAEHVARVLRPGVCALALVGDAEAAAAIGADALDDAPGEAKGPLAGVLAALLWAQAGGALWLVTAPCDAPLLPADFVERLVAGAQASAAVAETKDGLHPLCALWSVALAASLEAALRVRHPPIHRFLDERGAAHVSFGDSEGFLNVNTPEDLSRAEALIALRR